VKNIRYPLAAILFVCFLQLFACDEPLPEKVPLDERLIGAWVLHDELSTNLVESNIDQSIHEHRVSSLGHIAISGIFTDTLRFFESFGISESFQASLASRDYSCEPPDTLIFLSIKTRNGQSELDLGRMVYDPSKRWYVYLSQYVATITDVIYDQENRSIQFNDLALSTPEWSGPRGTIWLDGNISNNPTDITTLPVNTPTEVWSKYICTEKIEYVGLDFGSNGLVKRSEARLNYIENDSIGYETYEREWGWTVRGDSLILYNPGDEFYVFRSYRYTLLGSDLQLRSESNACISWDPIHEIDSLKCMTDFEQRARLNEGSLSSLRYVRYSNFSQIGD
jgi:hypothetical protein